MNFNFNQHIKKYSQNLFFDQLSYAQLGLDVSAFSRRLKSLGNDQHVAIQTKSSYLAFVGLCACLLSDKLAVMLSPLETGPSIEKLKRQIAFTEIINDSHFENLIYPDQIQIFPEIKSDSLAVVVFSSGTTSSPKGVALSFKNLYYGALGFAEFFNQQEQDTSLINLPHNHVGGLMILWRAFFSGSNITTDLHAHIDFISMVPVQLKKMLDNPTQLELLKNIRVILIGGAKLPLALKQKAESAGLALYETYGMSETASLVMINGEVLPYRKLKLDNEGFFIVAGHILAPGYFINQEFHPISQWFKTNDLGELTQEGKFCFKERADLVFISGGENINPLMIEEVVRLHPDIQDAYLMAIPDETWGEIGILLYESKGQSEIDLKDFLKTELHPHLIPKFFFKTQLIFSGLLKPKRSELKALASELYLKSIFSSDYFKNANDVPLVVLFHGFLGDKSDLLPVFNNFKENYSLLSIDLPGHGETRIENFHSLKDILLKLSSFIKIFSSTSSSTIFYGYSMGGRLALQLALDHLAPSKLFLESVGFGLSSQKEQIERLQSDLSLFDQYEQQQIRKFLNNWYSTPMFKKYSESNIYKQDTEKKSQHNLEQWKKSQSYLSVGAFPLYNCVIEQMKSTPLPIFYFYGEADIKYKATALHIDALHLKNLKTQEILGAGHNPHKTHPLEITERLSIFLK